MRISSKITFHMNPAEAEKILSPLGQKTVKDDTMQVAELFACTDKYDSLINTLKELNVDYGEFKRFVYSKKEIESAELLYAIQNAYCGYPQPDDDFGYIKVSYDLNSGCPNCSHGLLQNRPLRTLKPKMGSNDIAALHWEYEFIITSRLKNIIEQEGLTGCEFWPVIDHRKNIDRDDVYQLYIAGRMPPMSIETYFTIEDLRKPCILCGRSKSIIAKGQKVYDRATLGDIKDFNRTQEWLGGGYSVHQVPIVSKRVYDVFNKNKIRGVRFEPVKIIG